VWEPVLDSDTRPPRAADLRRVGDERAKQFWDPDVRVSATFRQTLARQPVDMKGKRSLIEGEVVWDVVAIFPPGAKWGDTPAFLGGPVVDVRKEALAKLREN
jgi:hypothetical protein